MTFELYIGLDYEFCTIKLNLLLLKVVMELKLLNLLDEKCRRKENLECTLAHFCR